MPLLTVEVPEYRASEGLRATWFDENSVDAVIEDGEFILVANSAGLRSLAIQLLTLAQESVPSGHHFHYSPGNELGDASVPIIIQKA